MMQGGGKSYVKDYGHILEKIKTKIECIFWKK